MYIPNAKSYSHETQSEYEPNSRDAAQDFLSRLGMKFAKDAKDQPEVFDICDFVCTNPYGELLRFEIESREHDLAVLTAGINSSDGTYGENTVHFVLRKYLSQADFFISYCSELPGKRYECMFIVSAFDVLLSPTKKVNCNNKNYIGKDLVFNVGIKKGSRFVRKCGVWHSMKSLGLDENGRRACDGSFVYRLRKDNWRELPVVVGNLKTIKDLCIKGV